AIQAGLTQRQTSHPEAPMQGLLRTPPLVSTNQGSECQQPVDQETSEIPALREAQSSKSKKHFPVWAIWIIAFTACLLAVVTMGAAFLDDFMMHASIDQTLCVAEVEWKPRDILCASGEHA